MKQNHPNSHRISKVSDLKVYKKVHKLAFCIED